MRRSGAALDVATAVVAGAAALCVETCAVRGLAPWFGQSNLVWANAVGVVLLGLALGAFVGGRAADGRRADAFLAGGLSLASIGLATAGLLLPVVGEWLAPTRLGGDRPLPLSIGGSLAATAALFGPASIALGILGPILVRRLSPRAGPGPAAATVSAASTLGGIAAALATPLVLLPALGARRTLFATSTLLALLALRHAFARDAWVPAEGGDRRDGFAPTAPVARRGIDTRSLLLVAAALVVGLAATGVEFASVRLLAPVFGQSSEVWALVLSTILCALALGYGLGARLARGSPRSAALGWTLLFAAAWLVAAGFVGPAAARAFAAGSVAPPSAPPVLLPCALATVLLFGPPVLAMGAAAPVVVARLARGVAAGKAAGFAYAAGTAGSFAGCFLAPLVTLPAWGTRATLLLCAGTIVVGSGLLALARSTRPAGEAA